MVVPRTDLVNDQNSLFAFWFHHFQCVCFLTARKWLPSSHSWVQRFVQSDRERDGRGSQRPVLTHSPIVWVENLSQTGHGIHFSLGVLGQGLVTRSCSSWKKFRNLTQVLEWDLTSANKEDRRKQLLGKWTVSAPTILPLTYPGYR